MSDFSPSPLQSAIGDALRRGDHNIMVEAVAGSGKTTTCVWLLGEMPRGTALMAPSIVFLAFNKAIAETLASRVPRGVTCSTFHSLGFRALKSAGVVDRKVVVDGRKCAKILWKLTDRDDPDFQGILKLVSLFKGQPNIPNEREARAIVDHYELDFSNEKTSLQKANEVLLRSGQNMEVLDFDDMLYLPVKHDVALDEFDWIFVDEAQDTNEIQLELLARLGGVKVELTSEFTTVSRYVAVGDRFQAIYGFRGANSDAMSRIATRFSMKSYPLDVSYRCPKNVVLEAQRLFL